MDQEHFALLFERAGYRVIRSPSSYWIDGGDRVFLSIPPDRSFDLPEEEARETFRAHLALGLKFCTLTQAGSPGALYIVEDKDYGLQNLHARHRWYVRRGLERCEVREIDLDFLARHGMPCNLDTLRRQGRRHAFQNSAKWERFCAAARSTPGAGAWGAFVQGTLAAYMMYFVCESTCHLLHEMSRSDLLKPWYPNHVLQYVTIHEMIRRDGICRISGGFESLVPLPGLDRYKRYGGYKKMPLTIRVLLRPLVKPFLLHPGTRVLLGAASRVFWLRNTALKARAVLDIASRSAGPGDPFPAEQQEKSK